MSDPAILADFQSVVAVVRDRLSRNSRIRRTLPGDGRLRLDRQLPFLCVYRTPAQGGDSRARELITTEAAYLFVSSEADYREGTELLCRSIGETLREHFGAILLLEFWTETDGPPQPASRHLVRPGFRIVAPPCEPLRSTVAVLQAALSEVRLHSQTADVETTHSEHTAPPGLSMLAPPCSEGGFSIGVAVRPVYRDAQSGALFPLVLQSLRRQLAVAIRQTVSTFTGRQEPKERLHYEAFGPSAMAKAGRMVDQQLAEVSESFDFLLQATPVNADAAWEEFTASGFRQAPKLHYRPLPYHPGLLKRQLYSIPLENVEDATLAQLFEEKQDELDKQLAALKNIDTPAFFYDSLQLYGRPDRQLVQLAEDVLSRTAAADGEDLPRDMVRADEVAAAAREQIDEYHQRLPDFHAKVHVVGTIASALMVAHDELLVSETCALDRRRVIPLLHHEVGTHLLTYFNGRQQPLRQLYAGLARYESLQEGLAVLAEHLAGGLTRGRMRTLAARVLAVNSMAGGADFVTTFELLHGGRGIPAKSAFMITLRAHRGGGLTKDALYLRGLRDLLAYLRDGHDLEPFYVGKISLEHAPTVRELRRRGIVEAPALLPAFWEDNAMQAQLAKCREMSLVELVEATP